MKIFRVLFTCLILTFNAISVAGENPVSDSVITEKRLNRITDLKSKIDSLITYSRRCKLMNPTLSLHYAEVAYHEADSTGYLQQKMYAALEAGSRHAFRTNFRQAMEMAIIAREIAQKLGNKKALGEAIMLIGFIRDSQGNYIESYEFHFEALKLFESIGDIEGIMKAKNGIGSICYYQGDYKKALLYYNQALDIARRLHDTIQMAGQYSNIGILKYEQGNIETALCYYDSAERIHLRLGLKTRLAANNISIAYALLKIGRYPESLQRYQQAIRIFTEFGYWHGLAIAYLQLSDYYKAIDDKVHQLKYIQLSFSTGKAYKLRKVIYQSAGALQKFYLGQDKIDSAYKYVLIENAEKDTIDLENSAAKLSLLETEYNFEKKQKEEKLKQQRKDFYIIIFIILTISGLIITFLFLSRQTIKLKNARLEKKQLTDELDFKNKELAINVMNLLKKNEFLVEHTHQLIEIQKKTNDEDVKMDILRLINSLQRGSGNEIWEEFELRFKQVHSGFYQNLLARFPDLTSNELKLCALLKLNLSTKEICELTGQRPTSLDVARSRLRRKLGLQHPSISLANFLSQF